MSYKSITFPRVLPSPPLASRLATHPLPISLSPRHRRPPCRRETPCYRDVRACPSGTFYAETRSRDMRLGLGTFDTVEDATRAYDGTTWRLNRPRRKMNFPEVMTQEWA
ncbi:hypothetical protein D1007_46347 [Hordeum vulgare]|nr:hypothetical protein D1007_46347 [Hordeum vulgare]